MKQSINSDFGWYISLSLLLARTMKKMYFFYYLLLHYCFQQNEMRKAQIKLVPSLLAFQCMTEKDPGTHTCWAEKILLMLIKRKILPLQPSHRTLGIPEENVLKILLEGKSCDWKYYKWNKMIWANKKAIKLTWFWWYLLMVSRIMFFYFCSLPIAILSDFRVAAISLHQATRNATKIELETKPC